MKNLVKFDSFINEKLKNKIRIYIKVKLKNYSDDSSGSDKFFTKEFNIIIDSNKTNKINKIIKNTIEENLGKNTILREIKEVKITGDLKEDKMFVLVTTEVYVEGTGGEEEEDGYYIEKQYVYEMDDDIENVEKKLKKLLKDDNIKFDNIKKYKIL